jgi:hypothetical protein
MACLQNQHLMKLVSFLFDDLENTIFGYFFFVDKMKQYLEQLRKECSDRMVNVVMDSETDKPSKV